MANAAITSLAAQASITLVNNHGDIGKTLKDLGDAVRNGLIGGLVNTVHGEIARSYIKDLEGETFSAQFQHKLAHALVGCAAGAAAGGACRDGAIGAAIAETVAELIGKGPNAIYT